MAVTDPTGANVANHVVRHADVLQFELSDYIQGLSRDDVKGGSRKTGYQVTSKRDSRQFAVGSILFGALQFVAGAVPSLLPWVYVLFVLACFPIRALSFHRQRRDFFLVDFCYWVNIATVVFLLVYPDNTRFQTVVTALADGPLSGALVVWQCAWVFGSFSHFISVMVHLLPGLALFVHKHAAGPKTISQAWDCACTSYTLLRRHSNFTEALQCWSEPAPAGEPIASHRWIWQLAVPILFYAAWQLLYWLLVQVLCRKFILANGYDTSYIALAKRAAKSNNIWNKLVRRGSVQRRICMYGGLQLIFTVVTLLIFMPVSNSYYYHFLWQVMKFVVSVYYGSKVQCEKVPQRAVVKALSQHDLHTVIKNSFPTAFEKKDM